MSNLSTHLFQVIDNKPTITHILINLPPFMDLYNEDASETKTLFSQQLVFIWNYLDATSPFFNAENKLEDSMLAAFGISDYVITPTLQACMDEYTKRQSTAELRSLNRVLSMLDKSLKDIGDLQDDIKYARKQIDNFNKLLDKEKDAERGYELLMAKNDIINSITGNNSNIIKQIPLISKIIQDLVELRKSVAKSLVEMDDPSSNKDHISNFFILEAIDTFRGYKTGNV